MLIEYTGDHRLYPRWLLQQLPTYSMQRNDLMQRLNCSTTWIDEIQRHVDFIKIKRSWIRSGRYSVTDPPFI